MDWMLRDECGLLYDRIAWALGFYNMVREGLIPLPFLFALGKMMRNNEDSRDYENSVKWKRIVEIGKNGELPWPDRS